MNETFSRYDTADYLKTEEDMLAYLDACLEEGDSHLVTLALADIARARGMMNVKSNGKNNNALIYTTH